MDYSGPLDSVPLWLLFVATVGLVFVAVEGGYRFGRYRHVHDPEKDAPVGSMVGAMLGLLAFMLAFTFGLAASRFDARRMAILNEANAIGTTYLRAGLLPEPRRTEIRRILREYVDVRLQATQPDNIADALSRSTELHTQLWTEATAVAAIDQRSVVTGLFIQSLNEVIDLHATRVLLGLRSRIPAIVWIALVFVAMVTMSTMGYQEGLADTRRSPASLALVITFSAVLLLTVDLDRLHEGFLRVSQQSMIDLQQSLKADVLGQSMEKLAAPKAGATGTE
jgi:hypothetical protein